MIRVYEREGQKIRGYEREEDIGKTTYGREVGSMEEDIRMRTPEKRTTGKREDNMEEDTRKRTTGKRT